MFVGVTRIVLSIPGARSLKDKRSVVRAFRDRARARLSVSIAEVGELDRLQGAIFGAAVVARDSAHCSSLLSEVERMARGLREALLTDVSTEIIAFGNGGSQIRGGIEQLLGAQGSPDAEEEEP
jgi:uncharacterized protein YlxP (DUF503 family)